MVILKRRSSDRLFYGGQLMIGRRNIGASKIIEKLIVLSVK